MAELKIPTVVNLPDNWPELIADKLIEKGDYVQVVRCRDCKHRDPEDHKCDSGCLERAGCIFPVDDNYYCADGERKENRT